MLVNIKTKQARDDPYVLITEKAIAESEYRRAAVTTDEDVDFLANLIGRSQ